MPEEPARMPPGNNQEPGDNNNSQIKSDAINVRGQDGITARKEGNIIHLEFDTENLSTKKTNPDDKGKIIPFPQKTAPTEAPTTNTKDTDQPQTEEADTPTTPQGKPAKPTGTTAPPTAAKPDKPTSPTVPAAAPPTTAAAPSSPTAPAAPTETAPDGSNPPPTTPTGPTPPTEATPDGSNPPPTTPETTPETPTTPPQEGAVPGEQPQPPKLNEDGQKQAAQEMKNKNLKDRMKAAKQNVVNAPTNLKNAATNKANALKTKANAVGSALKNPKAMGQKIINKGGDQLKQIGNDLKSTRARKIKMLSDTKKLTKEIKELQGKMVQLKSSKALRIIKFLFPKIYNRLAGLSESFGDVAQNIKVQKLEAKVNSLRAAKASCQAAMATAAILDAFMMWGRILVAFPVGTVIALLLGIIILPALWGYAMVVGLKFSKSFKNIIKQITDILKPLEEMLKREKTIQTKMEKRKEIRQEIEEMPATEGGYRRQQEAIKKQKEEEEARNRQASTETAAQETPAEAPEEESLQEAA